MIRFITGYLSKYKFYVILLVSFSIIGTASTLIVPYYTGIFIDALITTASKKTVFDYALIIIFVGIMGAVASYFNSMTTVKLTTKASFDLMRDTISHIQKIPYDTYTKKFNPAYLVQRIGTDVNTLVSFVIGNFIMVFLNGITFVIIIVLIAEINISIFLLAIAFLPVYLLCYMVLRKPLFKRSKEMKENQSHYSKVLFEQLNGIQEIKIEAAFDKSKNNMERNFKKYLRSMISFSHASYVFTSLDTTISICFQSGALIVGGLQIINGQMTVGEFTIVIAYFYILITIVKYYFNLGKSYQDSNSSYARMREIFDIEEERNGSTVIRDINSVEIKNVTYSHAESGPDLIEGLSVRFEKDKIYLITGPNGVGKTTLINIMLGILQNLKGGSVEYNGLDTSNVDLYTARKDEIATMLQRVDIPDATVEEYLDDALSLEGTDEILNMIRIMGLEGMYIDKNFDINEHWNTKMNVMSGGEKQRIILLKVLGKGSNVLIMDEPSTGLDDHSISCLLNCLLTLKKERIIILTSHDSRFKCIADEIVSLEECK